MSDAAASAAPAPGNSARSKKRSAFRRAWQWLKRTARRNSLAFYAFTLAFIFAVMLLAPRIFINIPAGNVGVLWLRFFGGTVTSMSYGEGVHVIFPWDRIYIYDARLQNNARVYDTISSNGLSMQVDIAVRYRINRDAVGFLHKLVGPNYDNILVFPEIGSQARELISRYTPEQLYSETRAFIQAQILERLVTKMGSSLISQSMRGKLVDVEDVLIRSVKLPPRVQGAIERKAEQYQAMLEYDYRIAREKKERERKQIEAAGIRDFQTIVGKSITDQYLRLRGIEATMALANSPNSKLIIMGGKDGLPIILNTGDLSSAASAKGAAKGAAIGTSEGGGEPSPLMSTPLNASPMEVPPGNAVLPLNQSSGATGTAPDSGTEAGSPGATAPSPAGSPQGGSATPAVAGEKEKVPVDSAAAPPSPETLQSGNEAASKQQPPPSETGSTPTPSETGSTPTTNESGSTTSTFGKVLKMFQ